MRAHLLLIFVTLAAPAPARAAEWGARAAVVAGGPSGELGAAAALPLSGAQLEGYAGAGLARGYRLLALEGGFASPGPGFYAASGLRAELVFDDGTRDPRLGAYAEFGRRFDTAAGRFHVGLQPMLFVVGIGPALGLNFGWRPSW